MRSDLALGHTFFAYVHDREGRSNDKARPVFVVRAIPADRHYLVLAITKQLHPWIEDYVAIPPGAAPKVITKPSAIHCGWGAYVPFKFVSDDEPVEKLPPELWTAVMKKLKEAKDAGRFKLC